MSGGSWKTELAGLVALAAFGLICPLLAAPRVPLVDPDEGLHASIAQEMLERGDWIVPRQLQQPFVDKPILYFWAIAASLSLFGNTEAAVRLPGLLFGTLGTLTTTLLAWRMLGRRAGLVAGIYYASMVLPLVLVQLPTHDVALVPWVNLALLCLWEADRCTCSTGFSRPESEPRLRFGLHSSRWRDGLPWAWTALAGVALGLSILTKGLAGIVIVGIAYGGYLALARRLGAKEFLRAAWALSIAAAVGSAWYIFVEEVQPGFLYYYFIQRHVLGFFTSSQPHGAAPWWYYLPILLVGGLPWIAYLPVLLWHARDWRRDWVDRRGKTGRRKAGTVPIYARVRSERRLVAVQSGKSGWDRLWEHFSLAGGCDEFGRRPQLLLGCWFVGCVLFLTASHSKLVTYIWPVFPAVAILAAIAWVRKLDGLLGDEADRWMDAGVRATCLFGPIGLPVALATTVSVVPVSFSLSTWIAAAIAGLTSLVPLWAWRRRRLRLTMALSAAAVCGQLAVLLWLALPQAAETLSARGFAQYYNRAGVLPSQVLATQGRVGSIVFYLDRRLRDRLRSEPLVARGKDGRLLRRPPVDKDDDERESEESVATRPVPSRFEWSDGATIR